MLRPVHDNESDQFGWSGAILGPVTPPGIGSNTSITIVYPAQLMVPDNHGSLVVTSVCLQSVALMVVVSLWVMAWQLHIKGGVLCSDMLPPEMESTTVIRVV